MFYKLAWSFHRSNGLEFEDLVSEASLLAVEAKMNHDPDKSSLSTFIYINVTNGLKNYIKKNKPKNNIGLDYGIQVGREERSINFMMEVDDLPIKTKQMVKIILKTPEAFLDNSMGKITEYFREAGWKYEDIWKGIREIKQLLSV